LKLGAGDHPVDPFDHRRLEAKPGHLVQRPSLVDPPEQEAVEHGGS